MHDGFTPRHAISIVGRIHTGTGARDVNVLDLSETGCRFHDRFGRLLEGTRITIRLGPIGPIEAEVKWREKEQVVAAFANPLYPPVLDHIRAHFDQRRG